MVRGTAPDVRSPVPSLPAGDPPVDVLIRNLMLRADKPARDWPNRGQHLNHLWSAALTDARSNPLDQYPVTSASPKTFS